MEELKNFFTEDNIVNEQVFLRNTNELIELFGITQEVLGTLSDEWAIKVEMADLEPVFHIDANILCQLLGDANEDRISDEVSEKEAILNALNAHIDLDALNKDLPMYYYPNGVYKLITKAYLQDWFTANKNV